LTGLGEVKLATGDAKQATAMLERALAIRMTRPGDPAALAETRGALARARAHR
jgi:Tfp pilus assembly protein PilF